MDRNAPVFLWSGFVAWGYAWPVRNRRRIMMIVVLGALTIGATLFLAHSPEPYYKGYPLSYWVFVWGFQGKPVSQHEDQAWAEMRADTNALPYLLHWIEDRPDDKRISAALMKVLMRFNPQRAYQWEYERSVEASFRVRGAMVLLKGMGPQAALAIPELERLLVHTTNDVVKSRATQVLGQMGEPGLPVLTAALANTNPPVRGWAAYGLQFQGTNASHLIPRLIEMLEDPDILVATRAFTALEQMAVDFNLLVTSLVHRLQDSNANSRIWAADRLRSLAYRKEAYSALPALQAALNNADPEVHRRVAEALEIIAPTARTNRVSQIFDERGLPLEREVRVFEFDGSKWLLKKD